MMDRQPEQRRDLAPVVGENKMGNEQFTIIEKRYTNGVIASVVHVGRQKIGPDRQP